MSKKTNPKKIPQSKQTEGKPKKELKEAKLPEGQSEAAPKKSAKAIIIAAAAIVVVAAVLVGIFVIKPAIDKEKEPTTVPIVTNAPNDGERYSYVDYNGTRMPVEFVEILNQAEIDSKKACDNYGVALEIGEKEISKSEFGLYYLDQYRLQMYEIEYSIEERGSNMTGYDPEVLPDEQNAVGVDYTFAEDFTRKAIEAIQINYASFDLAVRNGTQLTETEIQTTIVSYERIKEYAQYSEEKKTADEMVQDTYGAGTTYAMFAAREIMQVYATKYEEIKSDEYYNSYTEEEVLAKLNGNETLYKVVKARIFPIEAEYDPEEVSLITNEEQFLEFAQNNYPGGNFSAKYKTNAHYVSYETIGKTFGYDVADWAFSDSRVPGEIGLVQGQIYECLVYIEIPAFLDTSCEVVTYEYTYPEGSTEEEFTQIADEIQTMYDGWVEQNMTEEEFREACLATGYGFERTYRTGDLFFVVNSWILDENRKSGDMGIFNDGSTVYIVYYCHNNPEDFDWNVGIRSEMSAEKYNTEYDKFIEEEYQPKRNDTVIIQAQKAANVRITKNINEAAKEN